MHYTFDNVPKANATKLFEHIFKAFISTDENVASCEPFLPWSTDLIYLRVYRLLVSRRFSNSVIVLEGAFSRNSSRSWHLSQAPPCLQARNYFDHLFTSVRVQRTVASLQRLVGIHPWIYCWPTKWNVHATLRIVCTRELSVSHVGAFRAHAHESTHAAVAVTTAATVALSRLMMTPGPTIVLAGADSWTSCLAVSLILEHYDRSMYFSRRSLDRSLDFNFSRRCQIQRSDLTIIYLIIWNKPSQKIQIIVHV